MGLRSTMPAPRAGRSVALAISLMLVLGAAPTPSYAASEAATKYGSHAVDATNHQRDKRDRKELKGNRCLKKFARRQARKMAAEQEIWHQNLRKVLRRCDMNFVGENVAAGFDSGSSVVNRGWMKSKSHRKNLLEPKFRRVAVVARQGDDGRWYAAQLFGRKA